MKKFYFFNDSLLIKNMFIKNLFALLVLIVFLLPHYACNTTEPPPVNEYSLNLKLEDVSCTEAWLQFTSTGLQLPNTLTLYIDNKVNETLILSTADTLLYIDSLLPNQTYKILATMQQSNNASNELTFTTMDTTSHNFNWQTWTFGGQAGSCALYDVAIIDENNIWAVGEIYMNDSLGNPDPNAYNAIHWNGQSWELKKIKTNACGGVDYPPIKAIFAFSSNDILFAHIDGSISHFNGIGYTNDCSLITQLNGSANKICGRSRNDFYVVSGNGFIAHYQNGKWTKIESGTDLDFRDIYGATDPKTGEQQILAVCSRNLPLDKGIYQIEGNSATQISSVPIQWQLAGVWFVPNRHYYVVGAGIYEKKFLTDSMWKENGFDVTHYITPKIRGNNLNYVFVVGAFGEVLHFNGVTWRSYIEETGTNSGGYFSVSLVNNTMTAVGYENQSAVVIIGKRIN